MASQINPSLEGSRPPYPDAFPQINPLDYYRIMIAYEISRLTDVDKISVFSSLDHTSVPEHGDLMLAIPRLRIKGVLPIDLGQKIASEVSMDVWL
jgi:arginyl-tRNA synthetase